MGLTDRIYEGAKKIESLAFNAHEYVAHLANEYFGLTNYQLSNCAVSFPSIIIGAGLVFNFFSPDYKLPFDEKSFAVSSLYAFLMISNNGNLEKKELEIAQLESISNADVSREKIESRIMGALVGSASFFSTIGLDYNIIMGGSQDPPFIVDMNLLLLYATSAHYFKAIDYTPRKKGRVQNAIESLFLEKVAGPFSA